MTQERQPVGAKRWMALAAAIASASIVGIILSGIAPLLSLNLERLKVDSGWIGLMGATPSIAMISIGALVPSIMRRLGAAPSVYVGSGLALAMLLLFPLVTSIPAWFVMRFIMGWGIGITFVVSETWINALAPPEKRGSVMGMYNSLLAAGLASGPVLISVTGSEGALPFVAIAIVLVIAILPIVIANRGGALGSSESSNMPLTAAIRYAPAIMAMLFLLGAVWIAILSFLSLYGVRSGLGEDAALWILTVFVIGNVAFQILIGHLLDKLSATIILFGCGLAQMFGALAFPLVVHETTLAWLTLFLWGGTLGGVYTVALTMLGRTFRKEHLSSAMAASAVAFEVGALSGPLLAGLAMELWDPHGLMVVIGMGGAGLVLVALRPTAASKG